jgi:bifunctional DNA-binding transcriptional regulator/antitoxin component of YhaV-PrlF toxin-antitoxin module
MEVVEVADRYRITIKRSVREIVPLTIGQKVAVIPFGEKILIQPLSENPEKRLTELTKNMIFDKRTRKKASRFLISQAKL